MAAVDMVMLCDDLADEQQALDIVVSGLDDEDWRRATPSDGWSIHDEIRHLAYFDDNAALAISDVKAFRSHAEDMISDMVAGRPVDLAPGREMTPAELVVWWRDKRNDLSIRLRKLGVRDRIPWYGPDMSAMSFATARLMETWAHGQDIVDALGDDRCATDRIRHVVELGFRTRKWSYVVHGRDLPAADVRLELVGPNGDVWCFGDADAPESICGTALDFALIVTQRRHLDDTTLEADGDAAREWLEIAQAFAGPPGAGRRPMSEWA